MSLGAQAQLQGRAALPPRDWSLAGDRGSVAGPGAGQEAGFAGSGAAGRGSHPLLLLGLLGN